MAELYELNVDICRVLVISGDLLIALGSTEGVIYLAVFYKKLRLLSPKPYELSIGGVPIVAGAVVFLKTAAEVVRVEIIAERRAGAGEHNIVVELIHLRGAFRAVGIFLRVVIVVNVNIAAYHC